MNKSILTDVNSNNFDSYADTGPISDICDRIEEDIKNITKQNDK